MHDHVIEPSEFPPPEIIAAAEAVGRWFAERNIKSWELGPCASRDELERERMRLAACGVAALENTPESAAQRIGRDNPYWSASYGDVCGAVDREIALRTEAAEYAALCDRLSDILTRTANALKGKPGELVRHSWHDLPEVAKSLWQRFASYEDESVAYLDKLGDLVGQGEDEKLEDAIARVLRERLRAERERCAKACDQIAADRWNLYKGRAPYAGAEDGRAHPQTQGESIGAEACAEAIRALQNKSVSWPPADTRAPAAAGPASP